MQYKMAQNVQQHVADVAAAVSTVSVATYTLTDFLEQTALVVAIISGSLAIAWHIFQFVRAYRQSRDTGTKE